jgi:membrane-associated phospholipid phosphatase
VPRRIHKVLCLSLVLSSTAYAQNDTIAGKKPLFTIRDLIAVSGFTLATIGLAKEDRHLTHQLQVPARQSNRILKEGATIFRLMGDPGAILTGTAVYGIGLADNNRRTQEVGLHTVEAIVLANVTTATIKMVAGRARPYASEDNARNFQLLRGLKSDDYRSFPSGHTTSAFAFAATVSAETSRSWPGSRWFIGPFLYGGATLVGASRIYNKAHWASDVMAGAAIGTLTGLKVVRYQHSHPGNLLDRRLLRAGISHVNGQGWVPIVSSVSF